MWIGEFKLQRERSVLIKSTANYDVAIASYYLNVFKHDGKAYVNKVSLISGPDKKEYMKLALKAMGGKVRTVEGNQIFYQHEGIDAFNAQVMNSEVIFTKPIIGKGGFEYWTIASWEKKHIHDLAKRIAKMNGVKIWVLAIKQEPLDIFTSNVFEHMTGKQIDAIKKASASGYFDFPRKISLEELAKNEGVDESTFREHLRKAEGAIVKASL
jgi:hypothetical protein